MQSNRQRQIIQVLAEQGTMTAKELANCFSVSPRTIYRDIVALTAAGLPLSMTQGRDGGITLDPSYHPEPDPQEKTQETPPGGTTSDWIEIVRNPLFDPARTAVQNRQAVEFIYSPSGGENGLRHVEPLKLVQRFRAWYLFGYDRDQGELMYYRMSRMKEFVITSSTFTRPCPDPLPPIASGVPMIKVRLLVDQDRAWKIHEDFLPDSIQSGSRLLVDATMPDNGDTLSLLLSYGSSVEVLEPEFLRRKVRHALSRAREQYID